MIEMAKKEVAFGCGGGYGWSGMKSEVFAERMSLASIRFAALRKKLKFDAIAFTGSSGCAIGFNLAAMHNIPMIYVRKEGEKAHGASIECNDGCLILKKYLIVDDFIDSGSTILNIINRINNRIRMRDMFPAEQVGVLCFDPFLEEDYTGVYGGKEFKIYSCNKQVKKRAKKQVDFPHLL